MARLVPDSALAALNLGSALLHMDHFDEAIAEYRRSIGLQPNATAFSNLGTALYFLGRYEEAAVELEKATALAPANPRTWGNLGNALRQMPGRESQAAKALQRATGLMREQIDRNPGEAESWARLAGWHANLGQSDAARAAIEEALRRGADNVHCMVNAGHVYLQLGDRAAALRWLGLAVGRGYGAESLRRDPQLGPLHDDPEFERLLEGRPRSSATGIHTEVEGDS